MDAMRNVQGHIDKDLQAIRSRALKMLPKNAKKITIEELEQQVENLKSREAKLNKRTSNLEKRNIRLAELNQMKDDFIGIASHQLRTPVTGVKQYIKLLLDGYADELTPNQRIFLEKAHESNDRQLRIIDDLLKVARIDSETFKLKKSKLNVVNIVEDTIKDLSAKAENNNQKILFSKPRRPVIVHIDGERLRMALDNILDNAINYSQAKKCTKVTIKSEKDSVKIIVKDEGVGIDKKDLPRLFQKFSRIPNPLSVEAGGTGLGLYWAHKVVELHNGSIIVKSQLDKGSDFIVVLPKNKK